jgi:hypothetical protein
MVMVLGLSVVRRASRRAFENRAFALPPLVLIIIDITVALNCTGIRLVKDNLIISSTS